jgi:hypothetical protein
MATEKHSGGGLFGKIPVWAWILVVGFVLVGVQLEMHLHGAPGALLDAFGGLGLIAGSCEALIIAVEGMSQKLGWNKFVGGTIAAVVSNVPEIALLGFFIAKDPTMAFVIGLMTVYTNSMAFALYAVALPKDRGSARIPQPIVKAGTDLLSFGGGLCLALAGTMIVLREYHPTEQQSIGVAELYFIGVILLVVFATFLVSLVKFFSAEEKKTVASGDPEENKDSGAPPTPAAADASGGHAAPTSIGAIVGLMVLGVAGSFLGGHAMSDVGDAIVAAFPGLKPMQVALVVALIAGVPTYIIVINAHFKKQPLIALSNTFGGLTQNLFNVMAFCCLLIAAFNTFGVLHNQTVPITTATTLSVLFVYPTYMILSRAIEDDGQFNWIEIVSLVALFAFLMFLLTREA